MDRPAFRPATEASALPVSKLLLAKRISLGILLITAFCAVLWYVVPDLLLNWTDRLVTRAGDRIESLQRDAERRHGVTGLDAKSSESDYWNAADAYWYAAADLSYYLTAAVTTIGIVATIIVIVVSARTVRIATDTMRSSARQQQMRLLFDLDLALLGNPELLAIIEGRFEIDETVIARAKSSAFAHAFLNACDTIFDYYEFIDRDDKYTHWPAWKSQLKYYLERRPELRAMARQSIEREFYTKRFRDELMTMIKEVENYCTAERQRPHIVLVDPDEKDTTSPAIRELQDNDVDKAILRAAYQDLYVLEFPDKSERESLANMEDYLFSKKPSGWYGKSSYHIAIATIDSKVVGISVSDYFFGSNCGIVEFLVVAPEFRGRGVGRRLLEFTQALIVDDAKLSQNSYPIGVVAEINDPYRVDLTEDNLDPFDRLEIWAKWGFKLLHMPYIQPALSVDQRPVDCLLLAFMPLLPPLDVLPSAVVRNFLKDYVLYGMRVADPGASPQFLQMADWLSKADEVELRSLRAYIGRETTPTWQEVRDRRDPWFSAAMELYRSRFKEAVAIDEDDFAQFLDERRRPDLRYAYHLWVAPEPTGREIIAFASFFTLRHCGFGGYTVRKHFRGPKPIPGSNAIASVEERMRRDNVGIDGWFIECEPGAKERPAALFYRYGFYEVALEYRQPRLPGTSYSFENAPVLQLLYKPFGARFGAPILSSVDFLASVEDIFRVIYNVSNPTSSRYHQHLRAQLTSLGASHVPFKVSPARRRLVSAVSV